MELTHLDEKNYPKMVDVIEKDITKRSATACGSIELSKAAFEAVKNNTGKKGAVLQTAIVAAIMGTKKTSELIPMCHPLQISGVKVQVQDFPQECVFKLFVSVECEGKTGVEMESLTGVSIGLLTIYDMIKAIDKNMRIFDLMLLSKKGGKSGEFKRA